MNMFSHLAWFTGDPLHSRAHLPGCVLKMAAWLGCACGGLLTDPICNSTPRPNLPWHILFGSIRVLYAFQTECNFEQNLTFAVQNNIAGLCASRRACVSSTAVCNFAGLCAWFIAIESGNNIAPTLCTVVTWANVDQNLCYHMWSLGNIRI